MVAEVAVVGYPHELKGEGFFLYSISNNLSVTLLCILLCFTGVYAFITLKEHVTETEEQIKEEMRAHIKKKIAAYAMPDMMQVRYRVLQISR